MRRRGITGTITSLITFIILAGIFLAVLRRFDGDVVAAFQWIIDSIVNVITNIADRVSDMPWFRRTVG